MTRATERTAICLIALIMVPPITARAEIIEFQISGTILDNPTDPDGDLPQIQQGDAFTGFFRYDLDTPELGGGADPVIGTYTQPPPFVPLLFSVEGLTFQTDPIYWTDVSVVNDFPEPVDPPTDSFSMFNEVPLPPQGFTGIPFELGLSLLAYDTTVLSDIALPTEFDLAAWDEAIVFFGAESSQTGDLVVEFIGVIDQLQRVPYVPQLQAGDADEDLDFDQLDLVQVAQRARYLTGQAATWGDGDWDGAPGGTPGARPRETAYLTSRISWRHCRAPST